MKRCSHKPTEVIEIDGIKYYATDAINVCEFIGDLVINFTKSSNLPLNRFDRFSEIFSEFDFGFKEEIIVPWPDYRIPKVKISFWKSLHKFIISKGWEDVCIHCTGGHGRTGTALAALLIVHKNVSAYDAVSIVRERYCKKSVETFEQCRYLQLLDSHYNSRTYNDNPTIVPSSELDIVEDVNRAFNKSPSFLKDF